MDEQEPWYFEKNPSELYERLLVPSKYLPWAADLVDLSELGSGGKILDVARGTGTVTRLIPPIVGTAGRVAGLDFNAGRLAVAANLPRPAGCDIEWVEGDAGDLPFDSDTFDMDFLPTGVTVFFRQVSCPGGNEPSACDERETDTWRLALQGTSARCQCHGGCARASHWCGSRRHKAGTVCLW